MDRRKEYFESWVDDWDKEFTTEDREILDFVLTSFSIKEGARIVDLGCGTGVMFDMLRRSVGKSGMVVGIDYCGKMIQKAHRNFPFENIFEIDADVENLPIADGSMDCAISLAAFAHFSNQRKVLEEAARVLKPGGEFHVIHLMGSKELEEYHQKVGGPISDDHLPSHDDMVGLFEHGGFEEVKITDHPGLYLASGKKK